MPIYFKRKYQGESTGGWDVWFDISSENKSSNEVFVFFQSFEIFVEVPFLHS